MIRLAQWEQRLSDYLASVMREPHEFGRHDCMLFPAGVVHALTGIDHGHRHRGKYDSLTSAYRYLKTLGFSSPAEMIGSLLDEKPVGFAQRGDIVLCQTESGDNPGVCVGGFALVVGQQGDVEGLLAVPRGHWLKAWAI